MVPAVLIEVFFSVSIALSFLVSVIPSLPLTAFSSAVTFWFMALWGPAILIPSLINWDNCRTL